MIGDGDPQATAEVLRRQADRHPFRRLRTLAAVALSADSTSAGVHHMTPAETADADLFVSHTLASGTSFRSLGTDGGLAAARVTALLEAALDRPDAVRCEEIAVVMDDPQPPGAAAGHTEVDDDVQFTVYRPRTIRPGRWHALLAFVHRSAAFLDEDGAVVDPTAEVVRQAASVLGTQMTLYSMVATDSAAALPRGNEIVFEPWIDDGEVNPRRVAIRWQESIHRVDFRFRVSARADGRRLVGGLRAYLGLLLIAELHFTVRVEADMSVGAGLPEAVRASPYRRIFASYSHRDGEVVDRIRAAAAAFGDRYLLDVDDLRSGEVWEPRLAELVTGADVFQLFWSRNSMHSPFVRQEWEHALSLNRAHFVSPVYWEDPLPEDSDADLPPAVLRRLQFCRLRPTVESPTVNDASIVRSDRVAPSDRLASSTTATGRGALSSAQRPSVPTATQADRELEPPAGPDPRPGQPEPPADRASPGDAPSPRKASSAQGEAVPGRDRRYDDAAEQFTDATSAADREDFRAAIDELRGVFVAGHEILIRPGHRGVRVRAYRIPGETLAHPHVEASGLGRVEDVVRRHGIVVVRGPDGSGRAAALLRAGAGSPEAAQPSSGRMESKRRTLC